MNELQQWLIDHGLDNPHKVPPELKEEFDAIFSDAVISWPQPGGQEQFMNCPADICFYGGEAGAGKSWCLLKEPTKWIHIPSFVGVVGRKTYAQIFDAGGLWDEATKVYNMHGGRRTKGDKPKFVFPSGAQIFFKHSQHASKIDEYWQGLQSALILLDEITQFEKKEFLYIMSRNRSMTGIDSYIRATCNPDPRSWVREMIEWWIGEDGYIIPERSGVIRYFVHRNDKFVWADSREELLERFGEDCKPKSFTFIRGHLEDNQKLLEQDPGYKASLENLSEEQRRALSDGNWNEIENPNALFTRSNINGNRLESFSHDSLQRIVVAVDPAGSTNAKSDETGVVAVGKDANGHLYVLNDNTGKYKPKEWAKAACDLYDILQADRIVGEKNYGGDMVESTITMYRASENENGVSDIRPKLVTASKGKAVRAEPVAALYEQNMVHHVGHNLGELEDEMVYYEPGQDKSPNRLDALVWAITELAIKQPKNFPRIRQL